MAEAIAIWGLLALLTTVGVVAITHSPEARRKRDAESKRRSAGSPR